ncbi:hypothetical protein JOC78_000773 [Bacillus ectoiniformans]|nr:hypothetical protein [Bacillus ectoiniformans]
MAIGSDEKERIIGTVPARLKPNGISNNVRYCFKGILAAVKINVLIKRKVKKPIVISLVTITQNSGMKANNSF